MKAYTSFHSDQRQRSGNHKRHWFQWHGWVISLFLFSLIVSFAQPPSYNNEGTASASIATSTNSNASTLKHPLEAGDVLVKCKVITPHANPSFVKENEAYRPAHGTIQITVHQSIAPLASNAFLSMVSSHHFDGNYLFRVIHGFIVQWGIESPRANNGGDRVVKSKFPKVDIDPPPSPPGSDLRRTNIRGTLNFAGGNAGTGQVYINKGGNSRLDNDSGSLPFATLDEESMAIVDAVYEGYKQGMGQVKAVEKGDAEVKRLFPMMSCIEKCWIVEN